MAHGAERFLHQGKTALLWGIQVIAFPLYVAFQGVRSAARTLQATKPWQQVVALLTGEQPQPMMLSADSPVRALLSITQPLAVRQAGHLRQVDRHGELLRQSRAESVMVNGQWQMVPLQTPVCGVASDLASRQLVLVTTNNLIFNDLTDLQRQQLQRAITLLMAEYAGWCRRQWHQRQLQSPGLPLPQAEDNQWLPVRWFNQALAWMQVSPLAQVTNLFGEAEAVLQLAPQLGDGGMVRWWDRALSGSWRPALAGSSEAMADHRAALVANPHTSIPVPYGVSGWDWSAGVDQAQDNLSAPASLVMAGSSSVATQPRGTRKVTTYRTEDGTVVMADADGSAPLEPASVWETGYAHNATDRIPGWSRSVGGRIDLKSLPDSDAIEAQVALVNYVDHPLVVVLRWLDALLHQAETWLQRAWCWLWGQS
ncbi:MAG: hypothetical protein ACHWZW_14240 [Spirulina sp.]